VAELFRQILSWGPLGVLLVAALDSAGVPLPTGVDALLIATSAVSPRRAYLAALLATAGSLAGNLFLFTIARRGGEAYLARHTLSARARKFRAWFQHYGLITVFIPTFVPIVPLPLKVFVLSAGSVGVSTRAFLLTILGGRVPRFLAMAYLGTKLGENSMQWLIDQKWYLTAIAAGLFLFLFVLVKLIDYRRGARRTSTAPEVG
jgi:membrane protein DedA with SNARE-associated domain